MRTLHLHPLLGLLACTALHANNIQVTNTTLVANTGSTVKVQFDISWENSWRGGGVNNWDAAWVFVKYRQGQGNWQHVYVNLSGHTAPAGSMLETGLVDPASPYNATTNPVVGLFLRRNADGNGTFSASGVQLVWNYGALGIAINDISQVQVFAVEMVYVNQGSFRLGSGGNEVGRFFIAQTNTPFQVLSENAISMNITLGLWAESSIEAASIPASYPKGFNAFYCMKHELTQQAYVDFLNALSRTQQNTRTQTNIPDDATSVTNDFVMSGLDFPAQRNYIKCPSSFEAGSPITFFTVGPDVPTTFLSTEDLLAYLDWSGLRPMTDLEYEKSCRGPLAPVPNEMAWGTAGVASLVYTLSNSLAPSEAINSNYSLTAGNCSYIQTILGGSGPTRVGIFAAHPANSSRATSGASYYGIMELSGNAGEKAVSVRNSNGRSFTGAHGNGSLGVSGEFNVALWPNELEFRGGAFVNTTEQIRVSQRPTILLSPTQRTTVGGRGVRTAL